VEVLADASCTTAGYVLGLTLTESSTAQTLFNEPSLAQPLNVTQALESYTSVALDLIRFAYNYITFSPSSSIPYPITFVFEYEDGFYPTILLEEGGNGIIWSVQFSTTGYLLDTTNLTEVTAPLGVGFLPPGDPDIKDAENFWTAMNWLFNVWYWAAMYYDFGQLSAGDAPSMFANNTLLQSFTTIAATVLISGDFPSVLPLNETNRLYPFQPTLQQTYTCTQRQLKGWLTVTIFVIVADYTLALGAYNLFILIAGWWQKRKDDAGNSQRVLRY
jgi:hypothetical protein